ncbi:hypothetical protein F511_19808 [Dorcoceras hygrometricum]|uniref:Uncharacterized protein n=1 Tax=Dorcoceras hygrometricum TaxID=472368 RepID=A0A2Z7AVQ6_9LAMI|nr:hypothetical protein F511_19808 [Dorcoceras hygrometricum]
MEQENKQVHIIKEEHIREALDEKNRSKLVKGQTRSEKRKPDQGSWLSWMLEREGSIVDDEEDEKEEEEMRRQESMILLSDLICYSVLLQLVALVRSDMLQRASSARSSSPL